MKTVVLKSNPQMDEITKQISNAFDYQIEQDGVITEIEIPTFPKDFKIGLIVGSSGSGKSTILREAFGMKEEAVQWDNDKSIASHFGNYDEAVERLGAVGLNSIPSWLKRYSDLSNGEQFRADLARRLKDGAAIDEFTSVVNREAAVSCSMAIHKYINAHDVKNIVFASCHDDIIPYLQPDWVYNTDSHHFFTGDYLCRQKITIEIIPCTAAAWDMFAKHHYLSGDINKASHCYLGLYDDVPVAFGAIISMPGRYLKHAYREHRVVVLPDYQGMGIGTRFSEALGEAYHKAGCRYFSKTANPRMGEHRDKSKLWKPTSMNHKDRMDYLRQTRDFNNTLALKQRLAQRVCYSHEYIGDGIKYGYSLSKSSYEQLSLEL